MNKINKLIKNLLISVLVLLLFLSCSFKIEKILDEAGAGKSNDSGNELPVPQDGGAVPQPDQGNSSGGKVFAPFVDICQYPTPDLDDISSKSGVKQFVLGFIQADTTGNPAWGGIQALGIESDHEQSKAIEKEIADIRAIGGDVLVSFGGAAGTPLAIASSTVEELKNKYMSVITKYDLNSVDFDIEGYAVAHSVSIELRAKAIKMLQNEKPSLKVWLTLPVLPTGLTHEGVNVVEAALKEGVVLAGVNIMAMDYGGAAAPPDQATMGEYAILAATNTHTQLQTLYAQYGSTFTWGNLGVTPMFGVNDVLTEIFTLADASSLFDFANSNGVGMLSMWSIARDKGAPAGQAGSASPLHSGIEIEDYAFSKVFVPYGN